MESLAPCRAFLLFAFYNQLWILLDTTNFNSTNSKFKQSYQKLLPDKAIITISFQDTGLFFQKQLKTNSANGIIKEKLLKAYCDWMFVKKGILNERTNHIAFLQCGRRILALGICGFLYSNWIKS